LSCKRDSPAKFDCHQARMPVLLGGKSSVKQLDFGRYTQFYYNKVLLDFDKVSQDKLPQYSLPNRTPEGNVVTVPFLQVRKSPIEKFNSFSQSSDKFGTSVPQKILPDKVEVNVETSPMLCCSCKKSQCLKLYCECFANNSMCKGCSCKNCLNTQDNTTFRKEAMRIALSKNPLCFEPKLAYLVSEKDSAMRMKTRTTGCLCSKSHCLKRYCQCLESGAPCTDICKCKDCKNTPSHAYKHKKIHNKIVLKKQQLKDHIQ